jgi:hypothetical protein
MVIGYKLLEEHAASIIRIEVGGGMVLQNVGIQPPCCMTQQPRKLEF